MKIMNAFKISMVNGSFILGAMILGTPAWAQKDRKPSMACKFDIKAISLRSESAVEEDDEPNKKLVQVYPELADFAGFIPTSVELKVQYETEGCKDALKARVTHTPEFASAKGKTKAWFTRTVKLPKLTKSGDFILANIPVLEYYETLSPKTWAQSLTFDVTVFEDGREVATKNLVIDSPLSGT